MKHTTITIVAGCFLFILLWSSGWIGSKFGLDYAGTFTLLTYRYIVVVVALLAFVTFTKAWRKIPRSQLILHITVGVLSHAVYLGAGNSAMQFGVSAGSVAFIAALQPMLTATMSSGVSGERTSNRQWFGLGLGFIAIMAVIWDKLSLGGSFVAYMLPFVGIIAISLASVIDRRISLKNEAEKVEATPLSLVCLIHCSSALLAILPFALVVEGFETQWSGELIFSILWLGILVSLGAYSMMFFMLRNMSATKVACLEYLAPPATMVIAYFMLGESLTIIDAIAILVAAIAVWLVMSTRPVAGKAMVVNAVSLTRKAASDRMLSDEAVRDLLARARQRHPNSRYQPDTLTF